MIVDGAAKDEEEVKLAEGMEPGRSQGLVDGFQA